MDEKTRKYLYILKKIDELGINETDEDKIIEIVDLIYEYYGESNLLNNDNFLQFMVDLYNNTNLSKFEDIIRTLELTFLDSELENIFKYSRVDEFSRFLRDISYEYLIQFVNITDCQVYDLIDHVNYDFNLVSDYIDYVVEHQDEIEKLSEYIENETTSVWNVDIIVDYIQNPEKYISEYT